MEIITKFMAFLSWVWNLKMIISTHPKKNAHKGIWYLLLRDSKKRKWVFNRMDTNRDGYISSTDLTKFLTHDMGYITSLEMVNSEVMKFDKDGNGFLDFNKFTHFCRKVLSKELHNLTSWSYLPQLLPKNEAVTCNIVQGSQSHWELALRRWLRDRNSSVFPITEGKGMFSAPQLIAVLMGIEYQPLGVVVREVTEFFKDQYHCSIDLEMFTDFYCKKVLNIDTSSFIINGDHTALNACSEKMMLMNSMRFMYIDDITMSKYYTQMASMRQLPPVEDLVELRIDVPYCNSNCRCHHGTPSAVDPIWREHPSAGQKYWATVAGVSLATSAATGVWREHPSDDQKYWATVAGVFLTTSAATGVATSLKFAMVASGAGFVLSFAAVFSILCLGETTTRVLTMLGAAACAAATLAALGQEFMG